MATVKKLKQRRFLPVKCSIDGRELATYQITFDYGWALPVCQKHLEELRNMKIEVDRHTIKNGVL